MSPPTRDRIHAALTTLMLGPLRTAPPAVTKALNSSSLRSEAIAAARAAQPNVTCGGHAAIVTAGPPGAGKSTALHAIGPTGYRVIDPDAIKEWTIARLEEE